MLPFGWQLSHEKVPFVDANALLNAMRPRRTSSGVGSLPTGICSVSAMLDGVATFTTDTVFSSAFNT